MIFTKTSPFNPLLWLLVIPALFISCSDQPKENEAASENTQQQTASADTTEQKEFQDAPDFTLENMQGESFNLSDHFGKVIVLNIWATWCPPCREEIPDFIELQNEKGADKVQFVGVSVDREGWEVVRPFAKEFEINYPLVVDDGTVRQLYGPFQGIPTTFIINKQGKVEYVAPGMLYKDILEPILDTLSNRKSS